MVSKRRADAVIKHIAGRSDMDPEDPRDVRLRRIAEILEHVDTRGMAADGPVTKTQHEITDQEFRMVYLLAKGPDAAETPKEREVFGNEVVMTLYHGTVLSRRQGPAPTGVDLIAHERRRQVEDKGYDSTHDDHHPAGELALAAACYAAPKPIFLLEREVGYRFRDPWPWDEAFDYRATHSRHRQLVVAGALIAAELDRLHRHGTRK